MFQTPVVFFYHVTCELSTEWHICCVLDYMVVTHTQHAWANIINQVLISIPVSNCVSLIEDCYPSCQFLWLGLSIFLCVVDVCLSLIDWMCVYVYVCLCVCVCV